MQNSYRVLVLVRLPISIGDDEYSQNQIAVSKRNLRYWDGRKKKVVQAVMEKNRRFK